MDENQLTKFEEDEELRQTRMITGYYKDVRYTGNFGKTDASVMKWDEVAQGVFLAGRTRKVEATDGSYYILPEGDEWMLGNTMDEFFLKANAYILGYETRAEREAILEERKKRGYDLRDHLSAAGEDLRFTGEVKIDRSLFVADTEAESGFANQPFAKLITEDGRAYAIQDDTSPSKLMSGASEEELLLKARMYALGYMDRVKKEEIL